MTKGTGQFRIFITLIFLIILIFGIFYVLAALTGNITPELGEVCSNDSDVYEKNTHCMDPTFKVDIPSVICHSNASEGNNWSVRAGIFAYDNPNFTIANLITDYNETVNITHNGTGTLLPNSFTGVFNNNGYASVILNYSNTIGNESIKVFGNDSIDPTFSGLKNVSFGNCTWGNNSCNNCDPPIPNILTVTTNAGETGCECYFPGQCPPPYETATVYVPFGGSHTIILNNTYGNCTWVKPVWTENVHGCWDYINWTYEFKVTRGGVNWYVDAYVQGGGDSCTWLYKGPSSASCDLIGEYTYVGYEGAFCAEDMMNEIEVTVSYG